MSSKDKGKIALGRIRAAKKKVKIASLTLHLDEPLSPDIHGFQFIRMISQLEFFITMLVLSGRDPIIGIKSNHPLQPHLGGAVWLEAGTITGILWTGRKADDTAIFLDTEDFDGTAVAKILSHLQWKGSMFNSQYQGAVFEIQDKIKLM